MLQHKNDAMSIVGTPEFNLKVFSNTAADLTICATVQYKGLIYRNLPILRLTIEVIGDVDCYYDVTDDYSNVIPYLKLVPGFRMHVSCWIRKFLSTSTAPLFVKDGAMVFLKDLDSYSDIEGIIRQAKSAANRLSPNQKGDYQKARAVLAALGVTPNMDIGFETRDSVE